MKPENQIITSSHSETKDYNALLAPCHSVKIPMWLVLLDNIPTLLLFNLGYLIITEISTLLAVVFIIYALFSVVWFWAKICPYCHHYNTYACPCGYGAISQRFFKKRDAGSFKKVFRRNIIIVFPDWFVPLGIAVYLLITAFSKHILILTIIFSLIGFLIIPLISKYVGCKNCEIRDDCPWMNLKKSE